MDQSGLGLGLKVTGGGLPAPAIGKGRKAKNIFFVGRELTMEDYRQVTEEAAGIKSSPIKRISTRHHKLAKLVAGGETIVNAALMVGYAPQRASLLQHDPSFKRLVEFYNKQRDEIWADTQQQLADLGHTSSGVLLDRMEEDPDEFTNRELTTIIALTADRTGHGPTSRKEVSHTIGIASKLAEARQRIGLRRLDIVDAEVVEIKNE